ncbi:MAG: hypothetical protein QW520_04870 [Methanomassiliicoccales archaeon]
MHEATRVGHGGRIRVEMHTEPESMHPRDKAGEKAYRISYKSVTHSSMELSGATLDTRIEEWMMTFAQWHL